MPWEREEPFRAPVSPAGETPPSAAEGEETMLVPTSPRAPRTAAGRERAARATRAARAGRRERPRYPAAPGEPEQLSFEDQPGPHE